MPQHSLDARYMLCPLPVLKAQKTLREMNAGDILRVRVNNEDSAQEFKLFCKEAGHSLISIDESHQDWMITLKKA